MMEKQEHIILNKDSTSYKKINLEIGIGLNRVDNLTPSKYFYKIIEESKSYYEIEDKLQSYYKDKNLTDKQIKNEKECDIVSSRIAQILEERSFVFSPITLKSIHKKLFSGVFDEELDKFVGVFRTYNISKAESILGGDSITYGNSDEILEYLSYDFELESKRDYLRLDKTEWVKNLSKFISNIWQIHPFIEGNTRTIATFSIKYLQQKGIDSNNDIFKDNSLYFRNALVLANYSNVKRGITANISYLESFLSKLIIDKNLPLKTMPLNIFNTKI